MDVKALIGFAMIIGLLVAGLVGMFVFGRPSKQRKWRTEVGQGGDGGVGHGNGNG